MEKGMKTPRQAGVAAALAGDTSVEEVLSSTL
jgi:type II secretory ATPase GspE/PulE/Tfp pilus assembly ATPase PilB-like protein